MPRLPSSRRSTSEKPRKANLPEQSGRETRESDAAHHRADVDDLPLPPRQHAWERRMGQQYRRQQVRRDEAFDLTG